jgi:hypothetical protein
MDQAVRSKLLKEMPVSAFYTGKNRVVKITYFSSEMVL